MSARNFGTASRSGPGRGPRDTEPRRRYTRDPLQDGSSETTYSNWKNKYDGLLPTEMKQLEDEKGKLRKLVPDHA
jgi:hypothetical protein